MSKANKSKLQEQLHRRETELAALQQIAMAVAGAQDLREILQRIVQLAIQVMGCPKVAIFDLDEQGHYLSIRAWEGLGEAYVEASRQVDVQSHRAMAVVQGEPMAAADTSEIIPTGELAELAAGEGFRAFIDIPLRSRGRTLGLLSAYYTEVHEFAPEEIEMFVSFADQASVALETGRLLRDQQRRIAELSSLEEVGRAISGTLDLDPLLEKIYEQVSRVMDAASFSIVLYAEGTGEWQMLLHTEDGQRQPLPPRQGAESGLIEGVIRSREPLLLKRGVNAFLQEQGLEPVEREPRSCLGAPILLGDHVLGVIVVQSYEQEEVYDEGHQRILTAIARQAGIAIQNARYLGELERRVTELSILGEVGRAISGALDLDELLERIYVQVGQLVDTTNFYIALYNPEEDEVVFPVAYENGQRVRWGSRRGGEGLTEYILRTMQPLLLRSDVDSRIERLGAQSIGTEARCWLGVPMVIGNQAIGVIAVQSYEQENAYDEGHLLVLFNIARQAAVAVQNARTVAEIRQLNEDLRRTLDRQELLLQTIRQLSTPVVPLLEGILLLPLIGSIDSTRAQHILDQTLSKVQEHRARVVIVDITGVPVVDAMVAQSLVETAQAVHLLGAEAVLVGIMPDVAQTMVGLGVNLATLITRSDLQSGLEYAIERVEAEDFDLFQESLEKHFSPQRTSS